MELISSIWNQIQSSLFPFLEEELGELSEKHRKLISILEFVRIENGIVLSSARTGRRQSNRVAIARAFIAKAVYNLDSTRGLVERLRCDPVLRRICGWESRYDIPSESTFSRAFDEFACAGLTEKIHAAMTERYFGDHVFCHVSRDSTEIEAREKPLKREKKPEPSKPKRKRGRPKKGTSAPPKEPTRIERQKTMTIVEMLADLPDVCDRGTKTNSKGYKESWNGYKLHLDVADGHIPIASILTSASVHDSQAAIPLMKISSKRITYFYDLMDAAYDCDEIKEQSALSGRVPIVDHNRRRGEKRELPPAQQIRYKERTAVERVYGRLKDEFGCRMIRVRGSTKVMTHIMFGILALTADNMLKIVM